MKQIHTNNGTVTGPKNPAAISVSMNNAVNANGNTNHNQINERMRRGEFFITTEL